VPVNDIECCYRYPDVARFEIEEQDPVSYRRTAAYRPHECARPAFPADGPVMAAMNSS
jgi:hypothetical protein